jgi:hypothetical protein
VNAVMNLRLPWNVGNFLTSLGHVMIYANENEGCLVHTLLFVQNIRSHNDVMGICRHARCSLQEQQGLSSCPLVSAGKTKHTL